jgi:hypothetical protein
MTFFTLPPGESDAVAAGEGFAVMQRQAMVANLIGPLLAKARLSRRESKVESRKSLRW